MSETLPLTGKRALVTGGSRLYRTLVKGRGDLFCLGEQLFGDKLRAAPIRAMSGGPVWPPAPMRCIALQLPSRCRWAAAGPARRGRPDGDQQNGGNSL